MVARKGSDDTESGGALGSPFFAWAAERLAPIMKDRLTLPAMFLIFVILATGIVSVGCLYYQRHQEVYRTEIERNLVAITDLKVSDLARWRKDRLEDAGVFHKNTSFAVLLQRCFQRPDEV